MPVRYPREAEIAGDEGRDLATWPSVRHVLQMPGRRGAPRDFPSRASAEIALAFFTPRHLVRAILHADVPIPVVVSFTAPPTGRGLSNCSTRATAVGRCRCRGLSNCSTRATGHPAVRSRHRHGPPCSNSRSMQPNSAPTQKARSLRCSLSMDRTRYYSARRQHGDITVTYTCPQVVFSQAPLAPCARARLRHAARLMEKSSW